MSSLGIAAESICPGIRAGLKWLAHQHPILLSVARGARAGFYTKPKPVPEFDPLHPDKKYLGEFAAISPSLRDEMMVEFAAIAKMLRRLETGVEDGQRWLLECPINSLVAAATNLNMVYSPPKVGGSTVAATLQNHPELRRGVRHVHFLSAKGIAYVEQVMARYSRTFGMYRDNFLRAHWFRILVAINRALRAKSPSGYALPSKPFVVAGVRDPIALHLSFCYEAWWLYGDTPEVLTTEFVHDRLADDAWHLTCSDWFNNDLKEVFGIDVFAHPFPAERGWAIYENDQARVLVIRQESLATLPDALAALYRRDPASFTVMPANVAEDKAYARQYGAVKKTLRFSEQQLESIYALPYVQHFYTPKEIQCFKMRWRTATPVMAPAMRQAS